MDSGNEVAALFGVAYIEENQLALVCLDTVKCFDSVSFHSLSCRLRAAEAPQLTLNVVHL